MALLRLLAEGVYIHWCDGCKIDHQIWTEKYQGIGAKWTFNDDLENPTFSPSVNHTRHIHDCSEEEYDKYMDEYVRGNIVEHPGIRKVTCHYFITNGFINYCSDSYHKLSGQNVKLSNLPG